MFLRLVTSILLRETCPKNSFTVTLSQVKSHLQINGIKTSCYHDGGLISFFSNVIPFLHRFFALRSMEKSGN